MTPPAVAAPTQANGGNAGKTRPRPIVMLDADDVLAVSKEFTSYQVISAFKQNDLDWPEMWEGLFMGEAKTGLAALHAEFWPQYVISSSWSKYLSAAQLKEVFRRTGLAFVADNFHTRWTTPKGTGSARLTEIEDWLKKYRQGRQAVLVLDDDESGWSLADSHLDKAGFVVLCEPWVGLTAARLTQAQGLLRAQLTSNEEHPRRRPNPSE